MHQSESRSFVLFKLGGRLTEEGLELHVNQFIQWLEGPMLAQLTYGSCKVKVQGEFSMCQADIASARLEVGNQG